MMHIHIYINITILRQTCNYFDLIQRNVYDSTIGHDLIRQHLIRYDIILLCHAVTSRAILLMQCYATLGYW